MIYFFFDFENDKQKAYLIKALSTSRIKKNKKVQTRTHENWHWLKLKII